MRHQNNLRSDLDNITMVFPLAALRNLDRTDAIMFLWSGGGLTLDSIGYLFGLTRERIRQIIASREKRFGFTTRLSWLSIEEAHKRSKKPRKDILAAIQDGKLKATQDPVTHKTLIFSEDFQVFLNNNPPKVCPVCSQIITQRRKYCSRKCFERSAYRRQKGLIPAPPTDPLLRLPQLSAETAKGVLPNDQFVTITEAAKLVGVTFPAVARLIDLGSFSVVQAIGTQKNRNRNLIVRMVPVRQVLAYKADHARTFARSKPAS